ncbi:MAG: XRE family transcriptional regulator [Terracidiphilus sp.]|jgi:hypothetical protein
MRGVPRVSPVAIVTLSLRDLSAAADFSRIRNADLGRFTLDRLVSIINRLGSWVDVRVRVRAVEAVGDAVAGD